MNWTTVINANEVQAIELKIVSNKVTREKFNATVKEWGKKVSDGKANTEDHLSLLGFSLRN